jgi:uncharacterized protein (TIGR01777 family)
VNVLVAGATGFIGAVLLHRLRADGCAVTVLSRDAERARSLTGFPSVAWDDETRWRPLVHGVDAVINLSGASVVESWTPEYRQKIVDSRVVPARRLADAAPKVLVQASAVGFYGAAGDRILDETAAPGDDFLADVCVQWEDAAQTAERFGTRIVTLRIGQVLGRGGGTLEAMLQPPRLPFSPFRWGLGGPLGDGRQWVPWVHIEDVVGLFTRAARDSTARGPINAVAPGIVTGRQFAQALGRQLHRPAVIPIPAFVLKSLLGEFADSIVASQRIIPAAATALGYRFAFEQLDAALAQCLASEP